MKNTEHKAASRRGSSSRVVDKRGSSCYVVSYDTHTRVVDEHSARDTPVAVASRAHAAAHRVPALAGRHQASLSLCFPASVGSCSDDLSPLRLPSPPPSPRSLASRGLSMAHGRFCIKLIITLPDASPLGKGQEGLHLFALLSKALGSLRAC